MTATVEELATRIASLEGEIHRARARGDVENVFNKYNFYHNAFRDDIIPQLWVKRGTPGIRARYTNTGKYTDYDSIMAYHTDRPAPAGKLILHYTTTPVIEVAEDGKTAKGTWILTGTESGLTDPQEAVNFQESIFSPGDVDGKRVWAHWVWAKYALDFLHQDGEWRIWKFHCYEIARTPFEENWISFARKNHQMFGTDLAYFGENGKPVYMPTVDEPVSKEHWPYSPDRSQLLEPDPPVRHATFVDTFL